MIRLILFFTLAHSILFAQLMQMKPGESKVFKTKQIIETVFASEPKIFDYQLIDPYTIAVYSKGNGYGEIKVFSKEENGNVKIILDLAARIDLETENLSKIASMIEEQNPDSKISIKKLSLEANDGNNFQRGYMISGTVPNEEIREKAYITAATALGLMPKMEKIRRQSAVVTSSQGTQLGGASAGTGGENLDFLERVRVDGLVDDLDVEAPKQVNVKLIVADVEKDLVDKLGFDFNNGGIFRIPLLSSALGGERITSLRRNLSNFNLETVITAIKDDKVAKILATPNISVISGESASFQVTSQYTPISTTIDNAGNSVSSPQTPVDFGISLTVQPKIYSKDRITLNISQEVSNIQSIIEARGASAANLKKRRTQSVIELADGDSFVIGGLVDERDNEQVKYIPFLGDIPGLGALFRNTNLTKSKTELIVIATVNLTDPQKQDFIDIPTIEEKNVLALFFNLPFSSKNTVKELVANTGFIE